MTRDATRRYLIAYDVADDQRRLRIAHKLTSFGDRVQYSVFIVDARPAKLVRLRLSLSRLIDQEVDSVLFCDLGPLGSEAADRFDVMGRHRPLTDAEVIVL